MIHLNLTLKSSSSARCKDAGCFTYGQRQAWPGKHNIHLQSMPWAIRYHIMDSKTFSTFKYFSVSYSFLILDGKSLESHNMKTSGKLHQTNSFKIFVLYVEYIRAI